MNEFINNLTPFEQIYWVAAVLGSAVFVIVFFLTFIGGDGDADMEADATDFEADDGGVGFQFFTFKNIVAFFTIFGWSGLSCIENQLSTTMTLFISTLSGLAMMTLTSFLFLWINRLAESGSLRIHNAIGEIGEVYLPIGGKRSSMGKVSIKVQGSLRELEALTDEEEKLATGTIVKVVEVVSAETLLVTKV